SCSRARWRTGRRCSSSSSSGRAAAASARGTSRRSSRRSSASRRCGATCRRGATMPLYHQLGQVPRKRHTVFRRSDGGLYAEELIGNKGFTGPSSLVYHVHQPTPVISVKPLRDLEWQADPERQFRHRHFRTHQLGSGGSLSLDRIPLLFNADVALTFVQPTRADEFFYRNAQGDEIVFV